MLRRIIAKFRRSKPLDIVEAHDKEVMRKMIYITVEWYFSKCEVYKERYPVIPFCSEVTACYLLDKAGVEETHENMLLTIEIYDKMKKEIEEMLK